MIPYFIVRPGSAEGLQLVYDFDAGRTSILRLRLEGDSVAKEPVAEVDRLLRHAAALEDGWLAAVMPVREVGEPVFVEKWSWDPVERVAQGRVPHPKMGLMNMAASDDGALVLVDRAFRESGAHSTRNDALVLAWPEMELRATIHPMISALVTATFDDSNERLALVHVDQGGCEARLYRLDGPEPTLLGEFAQAQLPTDFVTGALAFVDDAIVLWTLHIELLESEVVVYDAGGETPSFARRLRCSFDPGLEDEPERPYDTILSNANPALALRDGCAFVGGRGQVHRVPLDGADPTSIDLPLDVVVQIRPFGDRLLAIDTAGELALVPAR